MFYTCGSWIWFFIICEITILAYASSCSTFWFLCHISSKCFTFCWLTDNFLFWILTPFFNICVSFSNFCIYLLVSGVGSSHFVEFFLKISSYCKMKWYAASLFPITLLKLFSRVKKNWSCGDTWGIYGYSYRIWLQDSFYSYSKFVEFWVTLSCIRFSVGSSYVWSRTRLFLFFETRGPLFLVMALGLLSFPWSYS